MENVKWYSIPGAPGYEVNDAERPEVRNAKTGRVLKYMNFESVSLYRKDKKAYVKRSAKSFLYMAMMGIDVWEAKGKTRNFSVKWDGKEFKVESMDAILKKAKTNTGSRMRYDRATEERLLKETARFMRAQIETLRKGEIEELFGFLSTHMQHARLVTLKHFRGKLGEDMLHSCLTSAALWICDQVIEGMPFMSHPAFAISGRATYLAKRYKAEAAVRDMESLLGKALYKEYKQNNEV